MVETVIKHLTEFKQLTEAAIPFRLLNEKVKETVQGQRKK